MLQSATDAPVAGGCSYHRRSAATPRPSRPRRGFLFTPAAFAACVYKSPAAMARRVGPPADLPTGTTACTTRSRDHPTDLPSASRADAPAPHALARVCEPMGNLPADTVVCFAQHRQGGGSDPALCCATAPRTGSGSRIRWLEPAAGPENCAVDFDPDDPAARTNRRGADPRSASTCLIRRARLHVSLKIRPMHRYLRHLGWTGTDDWHPRRRAAPRRQDSRAQPFPPNRPTRPCACRWRMPASPCAT